jgi:two-component system response regulator PilR (NtrC family)
MLAGHFLERFARAMDKRVLKISDAAIQALTRYSWPGNVRELENVIERAVALETTEAVLPERLPESIRVPTRGVSLAVLGPGFDLDAHLRSIEAQLLFEALERTGGDRAQAAAMLGVSPRSLRYLLQKHAASTGKNWHT